MPPLYYAMPIGLLTIFYLVARLGWLRAGFLYQAWQMLDCVWFVGIRYVYTDKVALVLDKSREGKKISKYLAEGTSSVLRCCACWTRSGKRRISTGDYSVAWRVVTVALSPRSAPARLRRDGHFVFPRDALRRVAGLLCRRVARDAAPAAAVGARAGLHGPVLRGGVGGRVETKQ